MIDLLVAGGGPAGLATALYGARADSTSLLSKNAAGQSTRPAGKG